MGPDACFCHRVGLDFGTGIGDIMDVEDGVAGGSVARVGEIGVKVRVEFEEGEVSEVGTNFVVVVGVVVEVAGVVGVVVVGLSGEVGFAL